MKRSFLTATLLLLCVLVPRAAAAQTSPLPAGSIAGWGWNAWGQIDPTSCCNTKHLPVNGPAGPWTAIATGGRVTVGMRPWGEVWEWGQSDSSTTCTLLCLPAPVAGLQNVTAVAVSSQDLRLALEGDGTVWQWQSPRQRAPFQVPGLAKIVQIAAGNSFALALDRNGAVWQWATSHDPKADVQPRVVAGLPVVHDIAAGADHSLAVTPDGAVWSWGNALDLAGGSPRTTPPIAVAGLPRIVGVAAGDRFSLVLTADGHVWSWGYNPYGELGWGQSGTGSNTPAPILALGNVTALSAEAFHAAALRSDGSIWTWGDNQNAQAGNGTSGPFPGCGCVPSPVQVSGITNASAVAAGFFHDVALLAAPLAVAPQNLGPCGPPPGTAPKSTRAPFSVRIGAPPSHLAAGDLARRLFLLIPGQYDDATDTYTCTGSLLVLDSLTGKPLAEPLVGKNPTGLIVDEAANRVFVVDGGAKDDMLHGDVRVFEERTSRLLATTAFDGAPGDAALAVHAGHLFVPLTDVPATDNHLALAVLGTGTGRLLSLLPLSTPTDRPVVDDAANRVFLHGIGLVIALNASTGQQVGELKQFLCSGELHDDAVDRRIISLVPGSDHNGEGSLCMIDPRTLRVAGGIDYGPNAGADLLVVDSAAHLVVLHEVSYPFGQNNPVLTVRDARTGHLIRNTDGKFVPAVADPVTGNLIGVGVNGNGQILNPHTWKVIRRFQVPRGPIRLTVSRTPHRLIVVSSNGQSAVATFVAL